MQVSQAVTIWLGYHKSNSRENTLRAYLAVVSNLSRDFVERNLNELTSEKILSFLNQITDDNSAG